MESFVDLVYYQIFQLYNLHQRWQNELDNRRRTCHSQSRPVMNLTARTPSFVSFSASANPGRTSYGYQDPGRSVASDNRTGKPVETSKSNQQFVLNQWKKIATRFR